MTVNLYDFLKKVVGLEFQQYSHNVGIETVNMVVYKFVYKVVTRL